MNQKEFEKKLLQEKIAAQRRFLQLEFSRFKQEMHPLHLVQKAGKSLAPKILATPALKFILQGKGKNNFKLMLTGLAAAAIAILFKAGHSSSNSIQK